MEQLNPFQYRIEKENYEKNFYEQLKFEFPEYTEEDIQAMLDNANGFNPELLNGNDNIPEEYQNYGLDTLE